MIRFFILTLVVPLCALVLSPALVAEPDSFDSGCNGGGSGLLSKTIYVPDDYSMIQDALDAAGSKDTIIVRPGLYVENLVVPDLGISLESELGPLVTIIDGDEFASVITIEGTDCHDTVIDGFTITNGRGSGGVFDHFGGGIYCYAASPTITGCIIVNNTARDSGGGICCIAGSPVIKRNYIADNNVFGSGTGAGIYCYESSATISGNIIKRNSAAGGVGGIFCDECSPLIVNNLIVRNSAGWGGGGICCSGHDAQPLIVNNTIADNVAGQGGGIFCGYYASPEVINTILWNNDATTGEGPEIYMSPYFPSSMDVEYSDVEGGESAVFKGPSCGLDWDDNIDVDPQFAEAVVDDYHLTYTSPCKLAGDEDASGLEPEDFEGDPRVIQDQVAIGADQFHVHLYSMDESYSPLSSVDVRIVGEPGETVTLASGTLRSTPKTTPYGDLYLGPPLVNAPVGDIPASGILVIKIDLVAGLGSGASQISGELPLQSLVGGMVPGSNLTNFVLQYLLQD